MNRHGKHNIRNGIVWAQTSHRTGTCTATLCVIEPRTHQKFESFKKYFRSDEIRFRICYSQKTPEIVRIYFGANSTPEPGPRSLIFAHAMRESFGNIHTTAHSPLIYLRQKNEVFP